MQTEAKIPRLPYFGRRGGFRSRRLELQQEAYEICGDIAEARIGVFKVQMVSSREYAQQVLADKAEDYSKSRGLSLFARPMLGNGLLASEGSHHKKQRTLIAPAFHTKAIAGYAGVTADATAGLLDRLSDGAELDLPREMMRLTLDIVNRTLFHTDVSADAEAIGVAFTDASRAMMGQLSSILPLPAPWPSPHNLRMMGAVRTLDRIIYRIIRERRERIAAGESPTDVLSVLLGMRDAESGAGMSEREVRDEAITLFLAGHETTANALSWAWYLLMQHPEAYDRLVEESARVLGGRRPGFADLPTLPWAAAVFKEAMRLYPPAYLLGRRAIRDTMIGPYRIEKGATVFVNIWQIHRRPDYWDRAEAFRPERFLDGAERNLPKSTYLPFGGGPRICIGNHFALMEGQLILAQLAGALRFERIGDAPMIAEPLITLRPKDAFFVRARKHPLARPEARAV
jgi:cytochrome P450